MHHGNLKTDGDPVTSRAHFRANSRYAIPSARRHSRATPVGFLGETANLEFQSVTVGADRITANWSDGSAGDNSRVHARRVHARGEEQKFPRERALADWPRRRRGETQLIGLLADLYRRGGRANCGLARFYWLS